VLMVGCDNGKSGFIDEGDKNLAGAIAGGVVVRRDG